MAFSPNRAPDTDQLRTIPPKLTKLDYKVLLLQLPHLEAVKL